MFPCSREDLGARFTVSVSTNEVGGQGGIRVLVVDAASREPLPGQASGSLETEVILGPNESVVKDITWVWPVPRSGPSRIPPPRLAFLVTVRVSDTMGNSVVETVSVPESLPRSWQVF